MFTILFSSASIILVIMATALICGIIPILLGYNFSYLNTDSNLKSLTTSRVSLASYALIFTCVPAILDTLFDILFTRKIKSKASQYMDGRLIIIVIYFLSGLQIFMSSQSRTASIIISNGPAEYTISLWLSRVCVLSLVYYFLSAFKPELFTVKQTAFLTLIAMAAVTLRLFTSGNGTFNLFLIYAILDDIIVNLFYIYYITKLWSMKFTALAANERAAIFYFVIVGLMEIPSLTMQINTFLIGSDQIYESNVLIGLYGRLFVVVIFTVVPGRLYQFETNEAKVQLIETKSDTVDFLFQKLRQPLQSVYFGLLIMNDQMPNLKLLKEELEGVELTDYLDNCDETVTQIEDAVNIMSGALNDVSQAISNFNLYVQLDKNSLNITKKQQIDLRILVKDVIQSCSPSIASKHISLSQLFAVVEGSRWLSFCTGPVMVEVDTDMIHQVILNLLSNATKYTSEMGHIKIVVYIHPSSVVDEQISQPDESVSPGLRIPFLLPLSRRQSPNLLNVPTRTDNVVIQVIDSGKGLTAADQLTLFQRDVQFKPQTYQSEQGQLDGLGLWVSKRLVELHGGTICVNSAGLGRGTTFTVGLPVGVGGSSRQGSDIDDVRNNSLRRENAVYDIEPSIQSELSRNLSEAFGCDTRINFRYPFMEPKSESSNANIQNSNINSNSNSKSKNSVSALRNAPDSTISTWLPRGTSIAIEGPKSILKMAIAKRLADKLMAKTIVPDQSHTYSTIQSFYSELSATVSEECDRGANVVIIDYYLASFSFFNFSPIGVYRPQYLFLLNVSDYTYKPSYTGNQFSYESRPHIELVCLDGPTQVESIDPCPIPLETYRQLGCYEVNFRTTDSIEDITDDILSIMILHDNESSNESQSHCNFDATSVAGSCISGEGII